MAKKSNAQEYGAEIGAGIKAGMQGLNTVCSPKSRKTCIKLIAIPLPISFVCIMAGGVTSNEILISIGAIAGFCLGLYQFYVGNFKKGLIYTITCGVFWFGSLVDLFKLLVTKTFKDSNGFPLLY